jgi:hypothetical protein
VDLPDTIKGGLAEGDVLIRRYHLRERLAEGGMSVIWRAFDQSLQRMVAVKVLDGSFDGDHGGRELIRREARAAARLRHPDVIEVYDYGETITTHGRVAAFVVMRLLDGQPLAERLLDGPLPWTEAVGIALRLALVLSAAHAQGIVHRDVTPENVLMTDDGAKLLDFGIAAIEDDHGNERLADYGTPPYVAPERLRGVTTDPAIDVYALGVLLFQTLTGHLPYPEQTWEALESVRRIGLPPEPTAPGLPSQVATLCRRCLSQEPEQRPTAQHVAEVLARSITSGRRASQIRRRWLTASAATAAVCAVTLTWLNTAGPATHTVDAAGLLPTASTMPVATGGQPAVGATTVAPVTKPVPTKERPKTVASRGSGVSDAEPTSGPPSGPEHEPGQGARTHQGHDPQPPTQPPTGPVASGPLTVAEAVNRFNRTLERGMAAQEIRPDVATDLRQVLNNAILADDDPRPAVADVRHKLADREREGALSPSLGADLGEQLTEIDAALEEEFTRRA